MKHALPLLAFALVASCAPKLPPKPPLVPKVVVDVIDTKPLTTATRETRRAVREVVTAGDATRSTAAALRAAIDKAQAVKVENEELRLSFIEIQQIADRLSKSLQEVQVKEQAAMLTIDVQDDQIGALNALVSRQSEQIKLKEATDESLRAQVDKLSTVSADLAIAEDKLGWWRKAALITWLIVALYIAARIVLRTVIPFRF